MIRSFIALDLFESTKESLLNVRRRLQKEIPADWVRWSRPASIHLTLKFLGDVAEKDMPGIKEALAQVALRHTPFKFVVAHLGCFPNLKRPRVVWVGVQETTGALVALQQDVEKSLQPLGFKAERRRYHPHLTLGRTRRGVVSAEKRRLGEIIDNTDIGEVNQVDVEGLKLMRSDLRPDGAVYTVLAEFELPIRSQ